MRPQVQTPLPPKSKKQPKDPKRKMKAIRLEISRGFYRKKKKKTPTAILSSYITFCVPILIFYLL
jgi:hypothetical protein